MIRFLLDDRRWSRRTHLVRQRGLVPVLPVLLDLCQLPFVLGVNRISIAWKDATVKSVAQVRGALEGAKVILGERSES
jgi:hypothetical protein